MALTTLILGAGLGREYGFPDGKELRKSIINQLEDHDRDLKKILDWSTDETVDETAAKYPEHAETIRRAVIKILRNCESEATLQQSDKPNTYKLILKQIADAQINGDQVKIITFNYDRSLPYLLNMVNQVEINTRKIATDIIQHVYGRLSPLWFEEPNKGREMEHHDYGFKKRGPRVRLLNNDLQSQIADVEERDRRNAILFDLFRTSKIHFIGENSAPKPPDFSALMEESNQIFFLGVGYHRANMNLLGYDFTKRNEQKLIVGTGLHLEKNYIDSIREEYPAIDHIESCDAHTFLKTKFNISELSKNSRKKQKTFFA